MKGFQQKESIQRENVSGKTVETSTRNMIVPEPIVSPYSIGLHQKSVEDIFCLEILHWLQKEYDAEPSNNLMGYIDKMHNMLGQKGEIKLPRETMEKFLQECGPALRMIIERQPVLWRYNTSGVLLEMCELYDEDEYTYPQNRCMSVNSMSAPGFKHRY